MQMLQDNEAHLAGLERKLELMGRELMLDNVQAKTPEQHKWLFWRNKQLGGSTEPDAINEMPSLRQAINMVSSPFIDRDALGIGTNIWRRRFACSLIPMLNSCEFLDEAYISHLLSQLPDAADKCEVAQLVAPHITRVASLHSVIEALPYLERADYAIQVLEQLKSSKNVLPSFEEFMQLLTSIKLSYAAFNETVSIRQQLLAHECRYMNYCLPNLALMAGFDATKIVAILKCLHSVKATSLTAWKLIDRIDTEDLLNAVLEHVHLDEQEDYRREVNERWECEKSCHLKLG